MNTKSIIFSSLIISFSFFSTHATDTITTTQILRDNGESLVSSTGRFELGFYGPKNSENRYVGIWYHNLVNQTVVWVANHENPLKNTLGTLTVIEPGVLVLQNSNNSTIWSTNTSTSVQTPVAVLLNSGNLVVKDENDDREDNFLWQSFEYPTDTFLPGMKLGKNFVTGKEVYIRSPKSEDDPASGDYTFTCDPTGYPQMVEKQGGLVKVRSGPWNGKGFSGAPILQRNDVFTYGVVMSEKEVYYHFDMLNDSFLSRFVLDGNGDGSRLNWVERQQEWVPLSKIPRDICDTYNKCGPYGSCSMKNSALCGCLDRFKPSDHQGWEIADWSNGCVRNTPLNCGKGDGFKKYRSIKLPDTRSSSYNESMGLEECKKVCLKNCSCMGYASLDVSRGDSGCLLWFDDLLDIREIDGDRGQDMFIRMASSDSEMSNEGDTHGNKSQTVPSSSSNEPKAKKRKSMAKRSTAWDHFEEFENEKKETKARCLHCKREFHNNSKKNGTTSLLSHLTTCPKLPGKGGSGQLLLNFQQNTEEGSSLGTWKFDKDEARKALAFMIIVDELPFKFVENEGFRHYTAVTLGPKFQLPSRWTMSRDCFQFYNDEKTLLKALLKSANQRVCLTTDTWSSMQRINYMCLTAHFIDDDWKFHKKILNFCPISSHKGKDIGLGIEKCLSEWEIDRVFTITVDNASSNDAAIDYLKEQMSDWKNSILKCELMHMRCIAHIINLVVVDGLKEIGTSIKKIRSAARYIRQSPARLKKFKECVEQEKIKSKSLLCLDVSTRWNSTYLMLESAQKFEKAFNRYDLQDLNFHLELDVDDGIGVPNKEDWQNARRMLTFLQVFYDLTVRISGSLYVTSNLFFHEIYMVHCLLKEWISSDDIELRTMAQRMKLKYDKYWGDPKKMNKVIFVAVVLDPRYKFDWVQFALCNMYGGDLGSSMGSEVKALLFSLYEGYKIEIRPDNPNEGSDRVEQRTDMDIDDPTMKVRMLVQNEYKKFRSGVMGGRSSKSEVDKYLNEESEEDVAKFDILAWWKVNAPRFPVISRIARDIFAIPISTVASESAFSSGGRVLDAFRSSLTPKIVQSLICAQDWLRKSSSPVNVEENLQEIEDLEKGLQSVTFEPSTDP